MWRDIIHHITKIILHLIQSLIHIKYLQQSQWVRGMHSGTRMSTSLTFTRTTQRKEAVDILYKPQKPVPSSVISGHMH